MPAIPAALSTPAAISPATNVPCPCCVHPGRAADEALRLHDLARELRVRRRRCRSRSPRRAPARSAGARVPEVERAVDRQVPLLPSGSFGTQASRRDAEPLDVRRAGQVAQTRGARRPLDDDRRQRREALRAGPSARCSARQVGDRARRRPRSAPRRPRARAAPPRGTTRARRIMGPRAARTAPPRSPAPARCGRGSCRARAATRREARPSVVGASPRHRRPAAVQSSLQLDRRPGGERPARSRTSVRGGRSEAGRAGATGTFSTGPASLPAAMRKLAGASSFTFAAQTGRAAARRRRPAAEHRALDALRLAGQRERPSRRRPAPPGRVSESEPRAVIHVERSPAAARSVPPDDLRRAGARHDLHDRHPAGRARA